MNISSDEIIKTSNEISVVQKALPHFMLQATLEELERELLQRCSTCNS
jgi:hypothetical protein